MTHRGIRIEELSVSNSMRCERFQIDSYTYTSQFELNARYPHHRPCTSVHVFAVLFSDWSIHFHSFIIASIIPICYNKSLIIFKAQGTSVNYTCILKVNRMQNMITCTRSGIAWRLGKYSICKARNLCKFIENPYKKDHNYITRSFLLLIFLLI